MKSFLDQVPNIHELHLDGELNNFNWNNFVNLKQLLLVVIKHDFNFELIKNLSKQLENIKMVYSFTIKIL